MLTELALAKHEAGSTLDIVDVMNLSTFLFAAGTDTTTKLVSSAVRFIAKNPGFEEMLRLESPVKSHFRIARTSTTVGGVDVPAGTAVMLLPGACNRNERKFPNPNEFRVDRSNVREQIAFIRGAHSCPGAPLARTEGRNLTGAHSRPDDGHHGIRGASRTGGGTSIQLRADVHHAWTERTAHRIHIGRLSHYTDSSIPSAR